MGWPIVGDAIYGHGPRHGSVALHLHAREVVVPLYKNRPPIRVTAPVPPHMHAALKACGWEADENETSTAKEVTDILDRETKPKGITPPASAGHRGR
jgi:tRNA pseudouridine32 synthase/23S rRNA pseudouridine746 synthase